MAAKVYARIRIETIETTIGLHEAKGEKEIAAAIRNLARRLAVGLNESNIIAQRELVKSELQRWRQQEKRP